MKEIGTTFWDSPNTGATNLSKFNARGAGQRFEDGSFEFIKVNTAYWTPNTLDTASKCWGFIIKCNLLLLLTVLKIVLLAYSTQKEQAVYP